ncbi:AAA family ATPase [Escherichia coli]
MIIWINGPFGAGKTTLAERLRDRRPKSLIFDPEEIGFVVKETVPIPASGDYQDLPLWRGLTIAAVSEIRRNYSQDIIIPMTLVHPDYLTEILDGLRQIDDQLLHIFLMLNEDLLRHRISNQTMHPDPNRNAEIREWRLANVARCLAARERLPSTTRVLDSGVHTPAMKSTAMVLDSSISAPDRLRAGSGNLHSGDSGVFCLTSGCGNREVS